jgi:hypothetical protein
MPTKVRNFVRSLNSTSKLREREVTPFMRRECETSTLPVAAPVCEKGVPSNVSTVAVDATVRDVS